jgi:hypothetical protein
MSDKEMDYSLIGEVEAPSSNFPVQTTSLAADEVTALDQGKIEYGQQKQQVELDRLKAELENRRQDTQLRKQFSEQIFEYLRMLSCFCGVVILLQGFGISGFKLDTPVLVTLVGGTAASAFGLVSIVLGGLFRNFPEKSSGRKT